MSPGKVHLSGQDARLEDLMNYKAELVTAGKQMLEKKLTVETWGNISLYDA